MTGDASCKNCGTRLELRYCPACGQDGQDPPAGLGSILRLLGKHLTGLEGTAVRTLRDLLLRPGRLTQAYLEGQRVRYVDPVRLYLWCTAAFFLLHAYSPFIRLDPATGAVHSSLTVLSLRTKLSAATLSRISEQGMSLAAFAPRFDAAVSAYLPVLLLVLVLASALITAVMFRRQPATTHAIFALHWSAFYFVLATIRRVLATLGTWPVALAFGGMLVALAYLTISMRLVYRRSWPGSVLRSTVSLVTFAALLVLWLWSTTTVAAGLAAWAAR